MIDVMESQLYERGHCETLLIHWCERHYWETDGLLETLLRHTEHLQLHRDNMALRHYLSTTCLIDEDILTFDIRLVLHSSVVKNTTIYFLCYCSTFKVVSEIGQWVSEWVGVWRNFQQYFSYLTAARIMAGCKPATPMWLCVTMKPGVG